MFVWLCKDEETTRKTDKIAKENCFRKARSHFGQVWLVLRQNALKLGTAGLWSRNLMNAEQIIQSTDPSLGPLWLHPSCYVFTVARSPNLIPSHQVHSCEPIQSNLLLEGTAGSCNVWEKQKNISLWRN